MSEFTRVEDTVDADGYIVNGYNAWKCDCGKEVRSYRGQANVDCHKCGNCFNTFGQKLRRNWRGNPSNYNDDIGDMEGYEIQHADW